MQGVNLGERGCVNHGCKGDVIFKVENLKDFEEGLAYGQCNECGQHYEVELHIQTFEEMIPLPDAEMQCRGKI